MASPGVVAVILAAGQGTRLRSAMPKVLHRVGGRALLAWVLAAAREAGCERLVVVVGHRADAVRAAFPDTDITWVEQHERRGTGHALAQAEAAAGGAERLLVLSGDVPLLRPSTLRRLQESAGLGGGAMAVARIAEAGALGRVSSRDGALVRIVEAADATPQELAIDLVNAGIYLLPRAIFDHLRGLRPANAQGELYLTDAVGELAVAGQRVALVELDDSDEALGVNSRRDLAIVHRVLLQRRAEQVMAAGVTLLDPASTVIEATVEIASDVIVHPGVQLLGRTRIGADAVLHAGCWLRDCEVGEAVEVLPYSVLDGARLGEACRVGPFARLRPGTELAEGVRVGNFVEIKATRVGAGSKVGHLAYLGDATLGERVNVGAGVVTCNYDGSEKHPTEVADRAFLGSDTMLVAPVRIGAGAVTAAGSVITRDVPAGALAVSRVRQRNLPGWAARRNQSKEEPD